MAHRKEIVLAPAGAGLPVHQMLALRWIVKPFVAERADWQDVADRFRLLTQRIDDELAQCTQEDLSRSVLVRPLKGLEDSSRYWSVAMTLEHIVIVGRSIYMIARQLAEGRVPAGKASTAAVKPAGKYTPAEALGAFRQFCDEEFPTLLPAMKNRDSKSTFPHPWMGSMTVRGWYWLLAAHHEIHMRQIQEIRKGLTSP